MAPLQGPEVEETGMNIFWAWQFDLPGKSGGTSFAMRSTR